MSDGDFASWCEEHGEENTNIEVAMTAEKVIDIEDLSEDAFTTTKRIEKKGVIKIVEFLEDQEMVERVRSRFSENKVLENEDSTCGDIEIFYTDGTSKYAEIKIEKKYTGNFFTETWSNKKRGFKGWMFKKQKAELLYYYFEKNKNTGEPCDLMFEIDFKSFKEWFGELAKEKANGRIYYKDTKSGQRFCEVKQEKYIQDNDTLGALIAVSFLDALIVDGKKIIIKTYDLKK